MFAGNAAYFESLYTEDGVWPSEFSLIGYCEKYADKIYETDIPAIATNLAKGNDAEAGTNFGNVILELFGIDGNDVTQEEIDAVFDPVVVDPIV